MAELGGTPEEASRTGFEVVERDTPETEQEVALDLLDVMEVVEVVAEEQEEGDEDDRQAPLVWGPVVPVTPLEALEILQLELGAEDARGSRAYARLKRKLGQKRRPHLERRTAIIQDIPGFWANVIVIHPQISAVIIAQDEDVLSYMTDLQVEELSQPKYRCRVKFLFGNNPYFRNEVIMKEYHLSLTGYRASCSSKIQWFWDDEFEAPYPTEDIIRLSFFDCLCDHNWPGPDWIAEIIIEDLWLNPLKYYPMEEDNLRGNVEESRNPSSTEGED